MKRTLFVIALSAVSMISAQKYPAEVLNSQDAEPATPKFAAAAIKTNNAANAEEAEFTQLMTLSLKAHQQKTVKLLNQLFDNDPTNREAILLVQNNSDCNMIIRIKGAQNYDLPVAARSENSVVVRKGSYQLSGNACSSRYSSAKSIQKNMLVTLNSSVPKLVGPKFAQNSRTPLR